MTNPEAAPSRSRLALPWAWRNIVVSFIGGICLLATAWVFNRVDGLGAVVAVHTAQIEGNLARDIARNDSQDQVVRDAIDRVGRDETKENADVAAIRGDVAVLVSTTAAMKNELTRLKTVIEERLPPRPQPTALGRPVTSAKPASDDGNG